MSFEKMLPLIARVVAKREATRELLSKYGSPSRGDVLHNGLVGAGEFLGDILGAATGAVGGEAVGGPLGAAAGFAGLGTAGKLGGGWAAHGTYLAGERARDFLSHAELPVYDPAGTSTLAADDPTLLQRQAPRFGSVFETGPSPVNLPPTANEPRGLPGMIADAGLFDPSHPDRAPPGGLLALIQQAMRDHPAGFDGRIAGAAAAGDRQQT
jgi:hypothetical protein